MPYISHVPMEKLTPEMLKVMEAYDTMATTGLSQFVRIFAQASEVAESFFRFYLPMMMAERGRIDVRILELARLKVAERSSAKP
jgi:hypothetical protein